jgi:hypothetical protein
MAGASKRGVNAPCPRQPQPRVSSNATATRQLAQRAAATNWATPNTTGPYTQGNTPMQQGASQHEADCFCSSWLTLAHAPHTHTHHSGRVMPGHAPTRRTHTSKPCLDAVSARIPRTCMAPHAFAPCTSVSRQAPCTHRGALTKPSQCCVLERGQGTPVACSPPPQPRDWFSNTAWSHATTKGRQAPPRPPPPPSPPATPHSKRCLASCRDDDCNSGTLCSMPARTLARPPPPTHTHTHNAAQHNTAHMPWQQLMCEAPVVSSAVRRAHTSLHTPALLWRHWPACPAGGAWRDIAASKRHPQLTPRHSLEGVYWCMPLVIYTYTHAFISHSAHAAHDSHNCWAGSKATAGPHTKVQRAVRPVNVGATPCGGVRAPHCPGCTRHTCTRARAARNCSPTTQPASSGRLWRAAGRLAACTPPAAMQRFARSPVATRAAAAARRHAQQHSTLVRARLEHRCTRVTATPPDAVMAFLLRDTHTHTHSAFSSHAYPPHAVGCAHRHCGGAPTRAHSSRRTHACVTPTQRTMAQRGSHPSVASSG